MTSATRISSEGHELKVLAVGEKGFIHVDCSCSFRQIADFDTTYQLTQKGARLELKFEREGLVSMQSSPSGGKDFRTTKTAVLQRKCASQVSVCFDVVQLVFFNQTGPLLPLLLVKWGQPPCDHSSYPYFTDMKTIFLWSTIKLPKL